MLFHGGGGGGGGAAAAVGGMLVRYFSRKRSPDLRRINPMVPREEAKTISKGLYDILKDHGPLTVSNTWNYAKISNGLKFVELFTTETVKLAKEGISNQRSPFITFVLGGPGSGKGTQCVKIAETFGFAHLSAGDLLRKEMSSDNENGAMIHDIIKEGKIVPSEITVNLIRRAIESNKIHKILIDGFPRSDENRIAFERIVGVEPDLVLFFDCPEEEMVKRVLNRNQGRIDDNIETIKKRLKVFEKLNLPVINHYSARGKIYKISAVGTVDEIFEKVRPLFASLSI